MSIQYSIIVRQKDVFLHKLTLMWSNLMRLAMEYSK